MPGKVIFDILAECARSNRHGFVYSRSSNHKFSQLIKSNLNLLIIDSSDQSIINSVSKLFLRHCSTTKEDCRAKCGLPPLPEDMPKVGKYKIVMVRHGESEWNEKNLFCGWFDANLSNKGKSKGNLNYLLLSI